MSAERSPVARSGSTASAPPAGEVERPMEKARLAAAPIIRKPRAPSSKIAVGLVILGFIGLAVRVALTLDTTVDLLDMKIANSERYLYYRITPTQGPLFRLAGTETAVRLVTHAVVPPFAEYDPSREVMYGVRVELDTGDGTPWQRDIYTRARQSKARRVPQHGGMWLDENTFSLGRGLEVTDDRLLVVKLPPTVRVGSKLRVTLLGDARQGYVRAYTPMPRDDVDRYAHNLPTPQRMRVAAQTSYLPWDRIVGQADLAAMRNQERRLTADGKDNVDYHAEVLYTTGFRLRSLTTIDRGTMVSPDHALAINVIGPARIDVVATQPLLADPKRKPPQVNVVWVGEPPNMTPHSPEPPAIQPLSLDVPKTGDVTREIAIPAGIYTATITSTGPAIVSLVAPRNAAVALGGENGVPLAPDEQWLPTYLTDKGLPAVEINVDGPDDLLGRVIRFDVRALASAPCLDTTPHAAIQWPGEPRARPPILPPSDAPPCKYVQPPPDPILADLTIDAIDAEGHVLARGLQRVTSEPSHFEQAKLFGRLIANVCEPVGVKFVAPPHTRLLRVTTQQPALLAASVPVSISPEQDQLDVPYDNPVLVSQVWRYGRYASRGWVPVRPRNYDGLLPKRVVTLATQARLEPRVPPPEPETNGVSITPPARLEGQTVVEVVPPEEAAGFVQRWDVGHYTRIEANKKVLLDLSKLPSKPSILYAPLGSDDKVVGAPVKITLGDQVLDTRFAASRGSLKVPEGVTGKQTLLVETTAPVRLLVDRPPVRGLANLYAVRSIYNISGGRVTVPVTKTSNQPLNVDIVVYSSSPAADDKTQLRVVVDGGNPQRISGVALQKWSLSDRTLPLAIADRPPTLGFANRPGPPMYSRLIVIGLGDDVPAGTHTIELSGPAGRNLWARVFTLDPAPIQPRALQWRNATDTGGSP